MKVAVSACLLGENCKYNGGNNLNEKVLEFLKDFKAVPICPESLGGLPIPREPAEIVGGEAKREDGTSVDAEFREGAQKALEICLSKGVAMAILQSRSPSCGVNEIYDGSFSGVKIPGPGVFAQMLIDSGIQVIDAEDIDIYLK